MEGNVDYYMNQFKTPQNQIICLGKNYSQHVKEMGGESFPPYPLVFAKPWSSLVCEPNPVELIASEKHKIEHEVELGFVISKTARNITAESWAEYVDAYFVCLDLTDRTFQQESKSKGWPWFYAKGQDTFLPISKLIPKQKVVDPHNLEIGLNIDGKVRQCDSTGKMFYKIGEQLEFITRYVTLNKGDLILTGTPHGVGPVNIGDNLYAYLKQDGEVLVEMSFQVKERKVNLYQKDKMSPKF